MCRMNGLQVVESTVPISPYLDLSNACFLTANHLPGDNDTELRHQPAVYQGPLRHSHFSQVCLYHHHFRRSLRHLHFSLRLLRRNDADEVSAVCLRSDPLRLPAVAGQTSSRVTLVCGAGHVSPGAIPWYTCHVSQGVIT